MPVWIIFVRLGMTVIKSEVARHNSARHYGVVSKLLLNFIYRLLSFLHSLSPLISAPLLCG